MATLSYCAIKNASGDLQVAVSKIIAGDVMDWNDSEIRYINRLFGQCEIILSHKDEILEAIEYLEEEED